MKPLVHLAGFALLLGICAVAVGRMNDRELLTPPPDAVAEGFFREIVTQRFDRARPYLENEPPQSDLQKLHDRIEQELGSVDDVKGVLMRRTDEDALVTVQLESAKGSSAIPVSLAFRDGEWKLQRVP